MDIARTSRYAAALVHVGNEIPADHWSEAAWKVDWDGWYRHVSALSRGRGGHGAAVVVVVVGQASVVSSHEGMPAAVSKYKTESAAGAASVTHDVPS